MFPTVLRVASIASQSIRTNQQGNTVNGKWRLFLFPRLQYWAAIGTLLEPRPRKMTVIYCSQKRYNGAGGRHPTHGQRLMRASLFTWATPRRHSVLYDGTKTQRAKA